jgi:Protein of unknown function (DUF1501)
MLGCSTWLFGFGETIAMSRQTHVEGVSLSDLELTRRRLLVTTAGLGGLSLPGFLQAKSHAAGEGGGRVCQAKSCIILYCWGGMSHHDTLDLKPDAPIEIRGEFSPIASAVPGIDVSEHLPKLARHTDKLAIIRSIHHDDSFHGRGMYWNLTGHKPPRAANIAPMRDDWPTIAAVISKFRQAPRGVPNAIRMPYPMVDNETLQAGEDGGWLGVQYDPIVMRPPGGQPYEGSSKTLGAEVLNLGEVDKDRLTTRRELLSSLRQNERSLEDYESFHYFRSLAEDILMGSAVKNAYNFDNESPRVRESYGTHVAGQSLLLARRMTEAGVPVVQVCCGPGDLGGGRDTWDTHGNNFNHLKNRLLPVFDHTASALLQDLSDRGTLDETLVAILTDFGRTPRVNANAGRDHYPNVYSIALAGGGIRGGQVYGSSDSRSPAHLLTFTPRFSMRWESTPRQNSATCSTARSQSAMAQSCRFREEMLDGLLRSDSASRRAIAFSN